MRSLFAAALNQALNTLIDSDTITLSGVGTNVSLSLISGVAVYKNGAQVAGGTVSDGDQIRIRVRSSTQYATPAFGIIRIGTEESIFSVVTIPDPIPVPITGGDTVLPFDVTQYSDGREYIPSQANNEVSVYSGGALVTKTPLVAPQTNTNKTTDAIVIANYHGNNVFFLNNVYAMLASINMGANSRPYGIAVTQTSLFDDDALTWITLSGLGQVKVLNKNYATVATYNVNGRPMGIASSADRKHVYVANYTLNYVTHFKFANGSWSSNSVTVGNKPFEIVVDANNDAWVTCSDEKVWRVTSTNVATGFTVTGTTGLRGITLNASGTGVWVAGSKSNTIAHVGSNGAVVRTVSTNVYPYEVNTAADGTIQVATFGTSQVYSYALDGTPVDVIDVDKMPYGLATYNGDLLVANLYSNTPDYATVKDQTAEQFSLNDPPTLLKNQLYQSSLVTVAGLNAATAVAVPDVMGAKLIKNGTLIGNTTTVVNGDTLRVQFTAPNLYAVNIEIPLFIGNITDAVVTKTELEDKTPDAFVLDPVPDAVPDTNYISNEVTITGVTAGALVPFSVDVGVIILNGVEQATQNIQVQLNDKIRLKVKSSPTDRETLYVTATYGITDATTQPVKTVWRVTTKIPVQELWIIPEHKGLDEFEPGFLPNVNAGGRYITRINFGNSLTSIPISNVQEAHIDEALLIPSYYDGAIYQHNNGAFKLLDKFALDVNKKPVDIAANRFVAYTGQYNRVMDVTNGYTTTLPGIPRKIIYDEASDTIYVSLANASIVRLKLVNGHYEITKTYSITGSSPYALALDEDGVLWFSDVKNQVIRYIDTITNAISTVAGGIAGGKGIWDMALEGRVLWTANSYDNTISKIDLDSKDVSTIKAGWVPTQIEVDTNGNVWVGHYASKNVMKFDPNGVKLFEALMQYASPTYMTKYDGHIYVTELYVGIVETQAKVSVLKPLLVVFEDALDALTDELVKSEVVTVKGLIRPTEAFIEPDNNYELYVNGTKVPSGRAWIDNGDTVQLEVVAPHESYTEKIATLNDFQSVNEFLVRTETDVKPDLVTFADMYGAIPQVEVESQTALITGMAAGHTTTLHVKRGGWKVKVNGGEALDEVIVRNGDIITLIGPSRASYNNPDTIDSKSSYPLIAGRHDYLLGTWTVHGRDIIGGMVINLDKKHLGPVVAFDLKRHDNPSWTFGEEPAFDLRPVDAIAVVDVPLFAKRERRYVESVEAVKFDQRDTYNRFESVIEFDLNGKSHVDGEMKYERRDASASTFEHQPVYEPRVRSYVDFERKFEVSTSHSLEFERKFEPTAHAYVDVAMQFELYALSHKQDVPPQFEIPPRVYLDVQPQFEAARYSNNVNVEKVEFGLNGFGMMESQKAEYEVNSLSVFESEAMIPTLLKTTTLLSAAPVFDLARTSVFEGELLAEKRPYIVHNYDFYEPAAVEGAWDTPQQAVLAGIAAGWPLAFAVEMRPNRFVYATPIDDGDMCGLPIPVDNNDQANARGYVKGG